jgi:uncharacterized repeat protein (TIGR03803 family)
MRWSRLFVRCGLVGVASLVPATPAAAQTINILHNFAGGDGGPMGSLFQSGSILYGLTTAAGGTDFGTVFMIGADGTGFTTMHYFTGSPGDGGTPYYSSLVQSGPALYGMTLQGGSFGFGGGSNGDGVIFRIGTSGAGYSILHSFGGTATDGISPYGSLVRSGSTLYGMTAGGGSFGQGTIFQIGNAGTGYSVLYSFGGTATDATAPTGSLVQSGATLYGMTSSGGSSGIGTIFKIGTDGTGYSLIHSFAGGQSQGGPGDGSFPQGSLVVSGSTLYGMTETGGTDALGTIFGINTDGSDFEVLHSFAGGPDDGAIPFGDLSVSNSTLYGMTPNGGTHYSGTIFSFPIPVPEPSSFILTAIAAPLGFLARRRCSSRGDSQRIAD